MREGPVTVEWAYRDEHGAGRTAAPAAPGAAVTGCRVEVWEETYDCWKHRLLRLDLDEPATRFTVPDGLLQDDSRFAVVVWARGPGGFSGTALAPFLYRPARDNSLLRYDPVRPQDLAPDGGTLLPAGVPVELTWSIRQPLVVAGELRLEVFEDAFLVDGAAPVFAADARGPAARIQQGDGARRRPAHRAHLRLVRHRQRRRPADGVRPI